MFVIFKYYYNKIIFYSYPLCYRDTIILLILILFMQQIKFRRQIIKSGGSYQVVLPVELIESMGLRLHEKVVLEPQEEGIFLRLESVKNE